MPKKPAAKPKKENVEPAKKEAKTKPKPKPQGSSS
jgi:hypothetical protein